MKRVSRFELWLSLCLLMTLVGNSAAQAPQPQKPPNKPKVKLPALLSAKPLKDEPRDDELRKLLKARYNEAVGEAIYFYELEQVGESSLDEEGRSRVLQRVMQAGLELCDKPTEKVNLLTQYVEAIKEAEKRTQQRYDAGRTSIGNLHRARYERLNAEILLLRTKRAVANAKDK